jgi:D-sedoheptulose 7-phosphate isomerase
VQEPFLIALASYRGEGERDREKMDYITRTLLDSAALKQQVAATQADVIHAMIECIWESLQRGGKLLLCGNGGSAADAQHLAAECMVRLQEARCPLPAIALTTDTSLLTAAGNDWGFETIFARQVEGLGRMGDVLLALSTSGNSVNVMRAVETAHRCGLHTLGLLGKDGGKLRQMVALALVVPSLSTQRVQEVHITVGHILCEELERRACADALRAATHEGSPSWKPY